MGLRYVSAVGKPICYESADVRLVDGVRDIPYEGALVAVVVPTSSERGCRHVGLIFDDQSTLIVDCLHSDDEVRAFHYNCSQNRIGRVTELASPILAPCPPPENQLQIADWSMKLFHELRPSDSSS